MWDLPVLLFISALTQPRAAVCMVDCAVSQSMAASRASRQPSPSPSRNRDTKLGEAPGNRMISCLGY